MNQQSVRGIGTFLVAGLLFLSGFALGEHNARFASPPLLMNTEDGKPMQVDFAPFWRAWNILNEKFVSTATSSDRVTDEDKVWGAIQGLAASLKDPYTVFLPPVQAEIFEADVRGNFDGIGMEVGIRNGFVTVVAPLKNTPAYRADIRAGDIIAEVDGKNTSGMSVEEVVSLIRGERGTEVALTLIREGEDEPIKKSVARETIEIPTLNHYLRSDGVYVIELYNFSANSAELFRSALRGFVESRTNKLILDLRGNPGGYLESSISMASWFLPAGTPVVEEDFGSKEEPVTYRSMGYDIFNDRLRLAILIDGGSASASEILAGALSEHHIGILVGDKTFGKGSVQELVRLTPSTSLKVTIARWMTPNGVSISASGITPEYPVKRTREDVISGRDPQRDKAIELLTTDSVWTDLLSKRRKN